MKNHLGSYECKLCLTLHNNEVRSCETRQNLFLVFPFNAKNVHVILPIIMILFEVY